jgi:2-succinyl-5-enolpyruvyl-6-hydroxy-3-cyclohexene-1-carboxylate synthase
VKNAPHHIAVGRYPLDADPFETASHHIARMPIFNGVLPADEEWLVGWQKLDADYESVETDFTARTAVRALLDFATARDLMWVSASNSVRIVDDVAPLRADAPMMLVNRGTNGIDGLIASATGAAIKHSGRTYLLVGDVAFLHDISSLALPSSETWPNLTIVVINNNGGEIFRSLEQGDPKFASVFDKVYSTPHGKSPAAIAHALGFSSEKVSSMSELENALASHVQVIEVSVN